MGSMTGKNKENGSGFNIDRWVRAGLF